MSDENTRIGGGSKVANDPAVAAFAAVAHTRCVSTEAHGQLAVRRAWKAEDKARVALFEAAPTTQRGALVHLLAAWRERRAAEAQAGDWGAEYRRIVGRPQHEVL